MDLAERGGDADGEAQEASHLHRCAEQPIERLAAGILEHQHDPAAVSHELQRSHRPRAVQFVLQSIFVSEAIEDGGVRMLPDGPRRQYSTAVAAGARTPSSAEGEITVLPQDPKPVISLSAEPRSWFHVQDSVIKPGRPVTLTPHYVRPARPSSQEVCHIRGFLAMPRARGRAWRRRCGAGPAARDEGSLRSAPGPSRRQPFATRALASRQSVPAVLAPNQDAVWAKLAYSRPASRPGASDAPTVKTLVGKRRLGAQVTGTRNSSGQQCQGDSWLASRGVEF